MSISRSFWKFCRLLQECDRFLKHGQGLTSETVALKSVLTTEAMVSPCFDAGQWILAHEDDAHSLYILGTRGSGLL